MFRSSCVEHSTRSLFKPNFQQKMIELNLLSVGWKHTSVTLNVLSSVLQVVYCIWQHRNLDMPQASCWYGFRVPCFDPIVNECYYIYNNVICACYLYFNGIAACIHSCSTKFATIMWCVLSSNLSYPERPTAPWDVSVVCDISACRDFYTTYMLI